MADEKKKEEKKLKKKRFILAGVFVAVVIAVFIGEKMKNDIIKKCNDGSIEACKEIENEWEYIYDDKEGRSKITNPYFTDKFKRLNEIEDKAKAQKARESQEIKESVAKMNACKTVLKMSLKDPDSYKELNSLEDQFRFGIIEYSATNSFGGRIRQQFNCNQ